ncbi:MAG TPA: DNA translocase FtsK, partial [Tepidisphaeraceae bacterium]|nr:DNA translocase FtsK [Tepidisphaeraceae bacterium]
WLFLAFSVASFHATDWPSHAIYPYPPIQNLCGPSGAFVAYWVFLVIGQGAFPLLFFTGAALAMLFFKARVTDFWIRLVGLAMVCVAFAAFVHHFHPASPNGFPEGEGGVIGIAASRFLEAHFNTVGTRLILFTGMIVGLLLAWDELLLRTPGLVRHAAGSVKENATQLPKIQFSLKQLPKLPPLPGFVTRDSLKEATVLKPKAPAKPVRRDVSDHEEMEEKNRRIAEVMNNTDPYGAGSGGEFHLEYPNDREGAAVESAHVDAADPAPAESAIVPPAEPSPAPAIPAPRPDIIVKLPTNLKPRQNSPPSPPKELGEYHLPPWDFLGDPEHGFAEDQEKFVREKAQILEQALKEFDIDAHVVEIDTGPVITMYEVSLAPGIKVSAITALSNDIQRALKAETVRIVAPVPGKSTVGIEVPNAQKEKVRLKELMQLAPEAINRKVIPLFLGKDASGEPLIHDLTEMPHCLIAGTTGSGKSVCINSIIMSILYKQRPDAVKLILIDPKVVEMAAFKDIPHLMCPVINDTGRATSVLEWACEKMDERYELLAEAGVRNIKGYNSLSREELRERFQPTSEEEEARIPKRLPYIVIIIDELADLMMTSGKEVEGFIVRLAQKSRAVGIHLILATQRPAATVVTGLIKSNMPARIAFRVQSRMDSRIVLDQNGADLLLGQGDMLFMPPGASKPTRSQGTFIDDKEMRETVKLVRAYAEAQYEPELVQIKANLNASGEIEKDELYNDAVRVVLETKRGSVSLLQRRLTIGYARASRLIEQMAATGILGEYKGSQAREVNLTLEEWDAAQAQAQADAADGMTV